MLQRRAVSELGVENQGALDPALVHDEGKSAAADARGSLQEASRDDGVRLCGEPEAEVCDGRAEGTELL